MKTPKLNKNKGFALMAAVILCTLLMITSTAMFMNMIQTRISLRKEMERQHITASKDATTREVAGIIGSAAVRPDGPGFESTTIADLYKAGSGRSAKNDFVRVIPVDPLDANRDLDPNDPNAEIMTSSKPFEDLVYPELRFNIFAPGTPFVGRQFAYKIEYGSTEEDNTTPGGTLVDKSGKSLIRVIELPMQFGAEGENFTIKQEGGDRILGNIMSKNINLLFKPDGAIVSAAQNILEAGGKSLHNATVQGLDAGIRATLGSSQRVELDASGACWFIPVGQRALSMYSIDKTSAPDKLELYAHPYYQTDLRVTVTQTGPNYATRVTRGGAQQPDGDDIPAMVETYEANSENQNSPLRVFPRGAAIASVQHWNRLTSRFEYVTEVDIPALIRLAAKSGIPNLQSVYVSSSYPVVLREGKKLTSKFSFVSNNDVYVPTSFGKDGKAFSVIAPHFYYGRPGYPVDSVKYVGQRVITSQAKDANGMPYPATAIDGLGTTLTPGKKQYSMTPIQRMQDLPPVYLKNWLIYLDAEYGNN